MELYKSVSPSRISVLNTCARKHFYGYVLDLSKPGETAAQSMGTAVHSAIEDFYKGGSMPHMDLGAAEWAPKYNACVDAFGTFSMLQDHSLQILATEQTFQIPIEDERISEGWALKGIIDVVARVDGKIWVGDHKTTGRKWPIEKVSLSLQHKIYELVIPELYGEECAGSFYNFIQHGESKGVPYANVTRTWLPRNENGLATAWEEVISAIIRIENGTDYRNVGDHCRWCDFYTLCQSDYFGGDTQAAIELNYVKKDRTVKDEVVIEGD